MNHQLRPPVQREMKFAVYVKGGENAEAGAGADVGVCDIPLLFLVRAP